MNLEQIIEYLGHLGWSHEVLGGSVVRSLHQGVFGPSKVLFTTHEKGLLMAINPVVERLEGQENWGLSVQRLIQALDRESPFVRIGLDKSGELYVKADLDSAKVGFEQFTYALINLCQIGEQLLVPVLQAQAYEHLTVAP